MHMAYSHEKSWKCFETIFHEKLPVKDSWNKLIDNKSDKRLFLKWTEKMYVTTGFDDGDYMNLTTIE
jgi:hypothetical protein